MSDDRDYPLGHIQMMGKSQGEMLRGEVPGWLPVPQRLLDGLARHALDFWLTSEDLPRPDNRVAVDRHGRISLHLHEPAVNFEAHRQLMVKLKSLLTKLDYLPHLFPHNLYMGKEIPIAGVAHQCGTIRFGRDPASSALDLNCKAHELDNLYVVDGSFFVSSSAVNPSLTIMANALRVADHLLERLGKP